MAAKIRKYLRRWRKCSDGSTAVEFALVSIPFMMVIIAIIELSLYFATASSIQGGVIDAARIIRTGQLYEVGDVDNEKTLFRNTLCSQGGILADCSKFQFEVRKLTSFNDDITPQYDDDGNLQESFEGDQISAGCVALIRVVYPYNFYTPFFGNLFADDSGTTSRRIATTVVMRTEPFNIDEASNCSL